ncbi:MAG TPA: protein-disulfide reductase DsbD domain-containing protein, partial [Caulobacteraceae bacterium]|nr:protein-disulfide reductase DsbD domain-containing protein [Caulobacteraceae bacterium]
MLLRLLILLAAAWALTTAPARAEPFRSERVELELLSGVAEAAPGSTVHVALRVRLAPGWHTYWKNAGDAGLPAELAWTVPAGWKVGGIVWPRPGLMPEGPLMTYGWEGDVLLPMPVTVPANARPGQPVALAAKATVLVCKDICVPEFADLSVVVPVGAEVRPDPNHGAAIARAVAAAPRPAGVRAFATLENGVLKIAAVDGPLPAADADGAYFFADKPGLVKHAAPQAIERGPGGLTLMLQPGKYLTGTLAGPVTGLLATKDGAWPIEAVPGPLPVEASGLGPAEPLRIAVAAPEPAAPVTARQAPAPRALGLPLAMALALLGGLILNLMPCVFPVLAMKAAALAGHAHAPAEARRDGLAFTAGVLTAFVVLALVLVAAKAAGEAAGWGFQLQSPWTTGALALVMLAVGLNLSGVYHVGMSLQGAGAWNRYGGLLGSFLTGALAVVVAAPCFAPFMTEAVGYGLTHSAGEAVVVFLMLGLGFALPYLALSLSPALARRMPRPGPWMNTLKSLLA